MEISDKGLNLIQKWEGLRLSAYLDPVGVPTIGYGTIRYPNGKKVQLGDRITEQQADAFLLEECHSICKEVDRLITVALNQNQFDALVSFSYNLGTGALADSTLRRKLNTGDFTGAANEFPRWNKGTVNGVLTVLPGLVSRRADEKALFESSASGGTPVEVSDEKSPQEEVTWLEGYQDNSKNVVVAWKNTTVIEIITLDRPNKEDLIAVLEQYPNANNFLVAPSGKPIPAGTRISFTGEDIPITTTTSVPPVPNRILMRGSEGDDVKDLQERLRELGYYQGTISGVFDSLTDKATKDFQTDAFGIDEADGKVGPLTWGKLWPSTPSIPASPATAPGVNYLRLTKTNKKDSAGCFILNLEYIKDGAVKARMDVCSGQPTKQLFRIGAKSLAGSQEPLPEGKWFINDILWADGKDNYSGGVFKVKGLGPVSTPLDYKAPGTTRRGDIEIHIDWNRKAGAPGTVGCVGVYSVADYKRLVTWLRETDPRELYVDWGLGTLAGLKPTPWP